jgi:YD repeat-containing protein
MIKRDIIETMYEYDKNGNLVQKTVTETHEVDDETRYPPANWISTTTAHNCTCSSHS